MAGLALRAVYAAARTIAMGCHNPTTHPFDGGRMVSPDWVFADVRKNPIVRGVTFSGGEPFVQSGKLAPLAERMRARVQSDELYRVFV